MTDFFVGGRVIARFSVEVHHPASGLSYLRRCVIPVAFFGRCQWRESTCWEPAETELNLRIEQTPDQLAAMVDQALPASLVRLTGDEALGELAHADVFDRVHKCPRAYDLTPDPYDSYRDRQLLED